MFKPINQPATMALSPRYQLDQGMPKNERLLPTQPAQQQQIDSRKLHCPHPTCKMSFSKKSDFIRHSNVSHYKFVLYGCPYCDYANHRTDRVTVHVGQVHKDQKGRAKNKPVRRTNRDRRIGEEPVDPCPFCKDPDFETASEFYEHLVEHHSGPPPELAVGSAKQYTAPARQILSEVSSRSNILPAPAAAAAVLSGKEPRERSESSPTPPGPAAAERKHAGELVARSETVPEQETQAEKVLETAAIKPADSTLPPVPADTFAAISISTAPNEDVTPAGRDRSAKRRRTNDGNHSLAHSPPPFPTTPDSLTGSIRSAVDDIANQHDLDEIDRAHCQNDTLQLILDKGFLAIEKMEQLGDDSRLSGTRNDVVSMRNKASWVREENLKHIARLERRVIERGGSLRTRGSRVHAGYSE